MKQDEDARLEFLEHSISSGQTSGLVDLLAKAMHDPSPSVRSRAAQIVAEKQIAAAVPMVEELLHDSAEEVRIDAVACLGSFKESSDRSRGKMRSVLKDDSFLVRIEAMENLALMGDVGALPGIAQLLADENPLVRAYSARAIADLEGVSFVKALKDAVRFEKEESARAGFLEALFLLGEKEVFGSFLKLLSSSDYRVRCAVANALEYMPLDQLQSETAITGLTEAERSAIGVADRSTMAQILVRLRERPTTSP